MELIVETSCKDKLYLDIVDGIILPLKDYAVESIVSFSLDEIKEISRNNNIKVYVKINKNLLNEDIDKVRDILVELDKLNISGIFFYDLAILQLKKELNLSVDLIWNQTHMVNNYKTCDYYFSRGVKYALLGKEITLEEIKEIIDKSKIDVMVEVVSKPSVAFSMRKLITNYNKDLGVDNNSDLIINEKITDTNYVVKEDSNGTSFYLDIITNGTGIISELYKGGCKYIIFREYGLEDIFNELLVDTEKYIKGNCSDKNYINKYKKLGDSTNFFFKETIYRVKKNG
ncbi:MAG: U32 family peptidase [Bacilli bacterium]|nr:U32 family peptidase [Bacilli bacterium]